MTSSYAPYSKLIIGGHRGSGCTDKSFYQHRAALVPPENSLASVDQAFKIGADYVEIDVVTSKDSVPICVHNVVPQDHFFSSEIPRATLNKLNLSEILGYSIGRGGSSRIATLAEILNNIHQIAPKNTPWRINIELKGILDSNQPVEEMAFIEAVTTTIKNSPLAPEDILFSSFALKNIIAMSHLLPKSKYGFLFSEGRSSPLYANYQDDFNFMYLPFNRKWATKVLDTWMSQANKSSRLEYLHPEVKTITDEMLQFTRSNNLGINSWPYKENLSQARLELYQQLIEKCIKLGIPLTIITDEVSTMRSLSAAYTNYLRDS